MRKIDKITRFNDTFKIIKNAYERYKNWTFLSKSVMILCIILIFINIVACFCVRSITNEINQNIDQQIQFFGITVSENLSILYSYRNYALNISKHLFSLFITFVTILITNLICKVLNKIKTILQIIAELNKDCFALKWIIVFDFIAFYWFIYTISGLLIN